MLNPQIYRMGLVAVAVAVTVLAFSLYNQQGPLGTTLSPQAFSGQNVNTTMTYLSQTYPSRQPGSAGDDGVASYVARQFQADKLMVSTSSFRARTAVGTRTLQTVTGMLPGLAGGSIVVVAHRDALGYGARADLSGTAALLELAQVLSGETLHRTIVLASTSGSVGAAGATQLARSLGQPVDAVIVLGDLAGAGIRQPIIVPWSNGPTVAPPMLRNTLAAAVSAQAQLPAGRTTFAGQLAHLAFPMAATEQGPFGARGEPAVLLSVSGERAPAADEATDPARTAGLGAAVLQAVTALDSGPSVPAPSAYLLYDGKLVPGWAVRLLVLALILPVLGATVDGLARARRRGHSVSRSVLWVLSVALPIAIGAIVIVGARLVGLIGAAPPGPVGAGTVKLNGGGIAALAIAVCVIAMGFIVVRALASKWAGRVDPGIADGQPTPAVAALLLVLCITSLAIWVRNPFAAALVVPALHLWMWIDVPEVRRRSTLVLTLVLAGIAPLALVAIYYAMTLGAGPLGAAWDGVLLLAGGAVGLLSALEWSVVLGCVASVIVIGLRAARAPRSEDAPVTIRGPVTYAGPGSLGGTKSALRR